MIKKDIKVDGMHCNSCVLAVQNSLEDVEGILKANADLDSGIVKLELDSDSRVRADSTYVEYKWSS